MWYDRREAPAYRRMRMRAPAVAVAVAVCAGRLCHVRAGDMHTHMHAYVHGRALGIFHSGAHGLADAPPLAAASRQES